MQRPRKWVLPNWALPTSWAVLTDYLYFPKTDIINLKHTLQVKRLLYPHLLLNLLENKYDFIVTFNVIMIMIIIIILLHRVLKSCLQKVANVNVTEQTRHFCEQISTTSMSNFCILYNWQRPFVYLQNKFPWNQWCTRKFIHNCVSWQ